MTQEEEKFACYLKSLGYFYSYEPKSGYCDFLVYKDEDKNDLLCLCELKTINGINYFKNEELISKHISKINEQYDNIPFGLADFSFNVEHVGKHYRLVKIYLSVINNYYQKNKEKIYDGLLFILPKDYVDTWTLLEIVNLESNKLIAVTVESKSGDYPLSEFCTNKLVPPNIILSPEGIIKSKCQKHSMMYADDPTIALGLYINYKRALIGSPGVTGKISNQKKVVQKVKNAYKQLKITKEKEKLNNDIPLLPIICNHSERSNSFFCIREDDILKAAFGKLSATYRINDFKRTGYKLSSRDRLFYKGTNKNLWGVALFNETTESIKIISNPFISEANEKLRSIFIGSNDKTLSLTDGAKVESGKLIGVWENTKTNKGL